MKEDVAQAVFLHQEDSRLAAPQSWKRPESHLFTLLQNPWYQHLSLILSTVSAAIHEFFNARGHLGILLPATTTAVSSPMGIGSDSNPVSVRINGIDTYLVDSMQFALELALRLHGRPTYYLMPSFRGEPLDDRHLNQFYHAETEIPGGLNEIMALGEDFVRHVATRVYESVRADVLALAGTVSHIEWLMSERGAFPRIRFEEAMLHLAGVPGAFEAIADSGEKRISPIGERALISQFGDFVWVTHMPWLTVPFYQAREPGSIYSMSADLLAGVGELLGSGERALDGDTVRENLSAQAIDPCAYHWYMTMKDRWPIHSAGFGLGVERLLLWLIQTNDIRDCSLLLRDNRRSHSP